MILGAASVQFFQTVTVRVEIRTVFFGLNSGSRDLYVELFQESVTGLFKFGAIHTLQ